LNGERAWSADGPPSNEPSKGSEGDDGNARGQRQKNGAQP
jgi:hypothetical protein